MKRNLKYILLSFLLLSLLFSCSKKNSDNKASSSDKKAASKTITIGASPVPHAEILAIIKDDLKKEGVARELINRIQNIRKDSGLEITDRITIIVSSCKESDEAIAQFGDLIKSQVLANDIQIAPNQGNVVEFDEFNLNISITKI